MNRIRGGMEEADEWRKGEMKEADQSQKRRDKKKAGTGEKKRNMEINRREGMKSANCRGCKPGNNWRRTKRGKNRKEMESGNIINDQQQKFTFLCYLSAVCVCRNDFLFKCCNILSLIYVCAAIVITRIQDEELLVVKTFHLFRGVRQRLSLI